MEKQRELARQVGYDYNVDCGAVQLYIFGENDLQKNLSTTQVEALVETLVYDDEVPTLTTAGLDIVQTDAMKPELHGYINFEVPTDLLFGKNTSRQILDALQSFLNDKAYHFGANATFYHSQRQLHAIYPDHATVMVSLTIENYASAYFELSTPINSSHDPNIRYTNIVNGAVAWADIQDFLINASSSLPYSNITTPDIYIGSTNKLTICDLQLAIETNLGSLRQENQDMTLPEWSNDVEGYVIDVLYRHLIPEKNIKDIADHIIAKKRTHFGLHGEMTTITQSDIVEAMAKAQSSR